MRDFAEVEGTGSIEVDLARYALERLGVDENGFDSLDRKFLNALVGQFSGGPVGVDTLASAIGEESDTLESVVEPYLIQEGFVQRTRGDGSRHSMPFTISVLSCPNPPMLLAVWLVRRVETSFLSLISRLQAFCLRALSFMKRCVNPSSMTFMSHVRLFCMTALRKRSGNSWHSFRSVTDKQRARRTRLNLRRHQRTVSETLVFEGVGLHSGVRTVLRVHPARVGHGLVFVRSDLEGRPESRRASSKCFGHHVCNDLSPGASRRNDIGTHG